MSPWLRISGLAALAVTLALAVWPDLSSRQEPARPARITTDTAAYCRQLTDRVDAMVLAAPPPVPPEALRLRAEGRRMCGQGQVRDGLICLRRAVLLLRRPPARP